MERWEISYFVGREMTAAKYTESEQCVRVMARPNNKTFD
jgi:hypothetical protein